MINTLLLPELREMLEARDAAGLAEFCDAMHPARAAEFMEGLTAAETWSVLQAADRPHRVEIFEYLDEQRQIDILETSDPAETSQIIADMAPDDRVDLLKLVDEAKVAELLPLVPTEERRDITRLSQYPEGTAGSLMTTSVARLPESLTVGEAVEAIAQQTKNHETIYYIYIVDAENHLRGLVSARQLLMHLGAPDDLIADLMQRDLVTVGATDDQEAVAVKVADYNFMAIPVVDEDHRLVGIITHDDVIDVVREEAEEDAYRMAAMAPMAEDYLEAPISTVWKKRAAWLACLFVAELFTFTALAFFEEAIASVLVLSLFVPLCISVGGNSGSQAATLITRAMALGYVGPAAWWRVLRHELLMGVLLGATLGTIGFVRGLTTPQSLLDSTEVYESTLEVRIPTGAKLISSESGYALAPGFQIMAESVDRPAVVTTPGGIEPQWVEAAGGQTIYRFPPNSQIRFPAPIRWPLAAVIAASVAAICLWGTLVGAMLPLAFSRLGFDPGYASSPFVATFVDVTGIVIYFSIAHLWLL